MIKSLAVRNSFESSVFHSRWLILGKTGSWRRRRRWARTNLCEQKYPAIRYRVFNSDLFNFASMMYRVFKSEFRHANILRWYIYICVYICMERLLCKSRIGPFLQSGSNFFGFNGMIAWSVTSLHVKICNLELSRTTIHNGIKHAESFTGKTGLKHCPPPIYRVCVLSSSFNLSIRSREFPFSLREKEKERKESDFLNFDPKESKTRIKN